MCRKVYIKPLAHELLKDLESEIKKIVGADVCSFTKEHTKYDAKYEKIKELLNVRQTLLNELFFATSEEIIRLEQVNSLLDELTKKMFHRTASLYRTLLSSYRDKEFDDDYEVIGSLKCNVDYGLEGECYDTVLKLDNDEFYGSDFTRMIVLLSLIDTDYRSYDEIERVAIYPKLAEGKLISDETEIKNDMDDGTTWAEAWLRHPKLDHLVICHAVHDICTHKNYSIPDLLRMNTFEVSVDIKIQQIEDQDGARCFWIQNYTSEQVKAKLLAEAEHRPAGMSLGDFVYRRCRVYYDTMVDDVPAELDCRGHDENVIPFIDTLLET